LSASKKKLQQHCARLLSSYRAAAVVGQRYAHSLPVLLALLLMVRHYVWDKFPPELQGEAWKLTSALCILGLLALVWQARWWPVFAVFAFEELQVAICSAWYMVEPWHVPEGMATCSAKAGIDLGAVGVMFVALAVFALLRRQPL
jgi:hypothetical protein